MESPQIVLYIEGTANTMAGLMPLVMIGRLPTGGRLEEEEQVLVREPLSYVVSHTPNGKCFALVDRKVRPYGSQRKGRLRIYIALPIGMQFANGQSPYTLLKEVYNTFLALYMYETPNGEHIFNEGEVNKEVFQTLLNKYRLEKTEMEYVPMAPNGPTAVIGVSDTNKVAELMRDSDYPEFRKYNRVEIGSQVASTIKIEIPRKIQFRVFLNKRPMPVVLSTPQDFFDSSKYLSDTEYLTYKDSHVRFTLRELMAARDNSLFGGRVILHDKVIQCEVPPKDREVKFYTEIVGENTQLSKEEIKKVEKMLEAGIVKVYLSGKDVTGAFLSGTGISLRGKAFTAVPTLTADTNYSFTVEKKKGRFTLFVKKGDTVMKKGVPPALSVSAPRFSKKVIALLCGCTLMVFLLGLLVGRLSTGDKQKIVIKTEGIKTEESWSDESNLKEQKIVVENEKEDLDNAEKNTNEKSIKDGEPELLETQTISIPTGEENRQTEPSPNYTKQILDAVNKRDWNTVRELLVPAVKAGDITVRQRYAIEALYWGTEGKPYSKAQMEKVKRQSKDIFFRSIDEIVDFQSNIKVYEYKDKI